MRKFIVSTVYTTELKKRKVSAVAEVFFFFSFLAWASIGQQLTQAAEELLHWTLHHFLQAYRRSRNIACLDSKTQSTPPPPCRAH